VFLLETIFFQQILSLKLVLVFRTSFFFFSVYLSFYQVYEAAAAAAQGVINLTLVSECEIWLQAFALLLV